MELTCNTVIINNFQFYELDWKHVPRIENEIGKFSMKISIYWESFAFVLQMCILKCYKLNFEQFNSSFTHVLVASNLSLMLKVKVVTFCLHQHKLCICWEWKNVLYRREYRIEKTAHLAFKYPSVYYWYIPRKITFYYFVCGSYISRSSIGARHNNRN